MFNKIKKFFTRKNIIRLLVFLECGLIFLIGKSIYDNYIFKQNAQVITYEEGVNKVKEGFIYKIVIDKDKAYFYETNRTLLDSLLFKANDKTCNLYVIENIQDIEELTKAIKEHASTLKKDSTVGDCLFIFIVHTLLIWGLGAILLKRSSGYIFKKKKRKLGPDGKETVNNEMEERPKVRFSDVAGCDEAKESLVEMVDFLHNPKKYTKIGAKLPKGALMVGSPGCGKTLLAKAVAGEAGVPFFYKSASEFVELYVGQGAKHIRELFKEAKENSPCIVFIDEIDAIGRSRDGNNITSNDSEKDQTLNELLTHMDGFEENNGIIVMGATNRPEILDKALIRPGRFDRQVIVEKPDLKGRIEILKVHAKNVKLADDVNFEEIALQTSGCSGAELASIVNEAAIYAVKNGKEKVSQDDLKKCIEIVLVGKEKKDRKMNEKERQIVAFHECGHAFVNIAQSGHEPVQKISIIPVDKAGALGYVMNWPEEERYLLSKKELEYKIRICLGGRAAEEVFFGKDNVTGGCSNDIEKASEMIKKMITQFGMSDKLGLYSVARTTGRYLDNRAEIDCSPELQAKIDKEIIESLENYYKQAKSIIEKNKKPMKAIANHLLKHDTITGVEFKKLFEENKGKIMKF